MSPSQLRSLKRLNAIGRFFVVWGYIFGFGVGAMILFLSLSYKVDYIWMFYALVFCFIYAFLNIKFGTKIRTFKVGTRASLGPAFGILILLNFGGGVGLLLLPVLLYGVYLWRRQLI